LPAIKSNGSPLAFMKNDLAAYSQYVLVKEIPYAEE
jgi:hypothetical protein